MRLLKVWQDYSRSPDYAALYLGMGAPFVRPAPDWHPGYMSFFIRDERANAEARHLNVHVANDCIPFLRDVDPPAPAQYLFCIDRADC